MKSKGFYGTLVLILLTIILPITSYFYLKMGESTYLENKLKIYGPRYFDTSLNDTVYHRIPPFKLIAHTGDTISHKDMLGKIYVADFFFTHCQGICPKMTNNFTRIQEQFMHEEDSIFLLSHTVDPARDSVPRLREYAEMFEADPSKWFFLTGPKPELYRLARKGYFITTQDGDGSAEDFVHSEKFILVDKLGRIRGYYDGTDSMEVKHLMRDIIFLTAEKI